MFAIGPGGQAREIDKIGQEDNLTTGIQGFDASGARYYMIDSRGRDTAALFEVDVATSKRTVLAEHPKADAGALLVHPTTGVVRAVSFEHARQEWKILDPAVAPDFVALAKLDDGDLGIVSTSADDRRWIVTYNDDDDPAHVYLWDRDALRGTFLYGPRPVLEDLPLAQSTRSRSRRATGSTW